MMDFYGPFVTDVGERVWSGHYGQTDAANDTSRLFQRLARDWARTWRIATDGVSIWVEMTGRSTAGAEPGRSAATTEHTVLMAKSRSDDSAVSITDLTRVGKKVAIIPSLELIVTPSVIDKVDRAYVTVQAENINSPPASMKGPLVAGTGGNQAPALFCVSHPELAGDLGGDRWRRRGTPAPRRKTAWRG